MPNHTCDSLPFQRLDVYRTIAVDPVGRRGDRHPGGLAKDFAQRTHQAKIRDAELRDQATRAAKSLFLHLCEGLPNQSIPMRRRYFVGARNSLSEAVGALDLALSLTAIAPELAQPLQTLGLRLHQILTVLLR